MESLWIELATKFMSLGAKQAPDKIASTLKEHSQTKLRAIVEKYRSFGFDNAATNVDVKVVVLLSAREGDSFKAIIGLKSPLVRLAIIHYEPDNEV